LYAHHYIHTTHCYKTFLYKLFTKYKYILFITTLPYRITPQHVITLPVKCLNMQNETVCKFRSNIKDICILHTMRINFKTMQISIKLSCWAVRTQIDSLILRYLRKQRISLRLKSTNLAEMSLLILSPFHWVWLQFCLVVVTSLISSDSTYPNPCFALQVCTKHTHQIYSTRLANDVAGYQLWR